EASFRSYTDKRKKSWCCIKCREGSSKIIAINKNIKSIPAMEDCNIVSKEQLLDLTKSINFMSNQFDDFTIQIRDLVNSVKEIKEENRHLKEQNIKLKSEVSIINKRINVIEQEQYSKHIELIGLPEHNNENCIKTVENISVAVGGKVNVEKAYRVRLKMTGKPGKIVAILKSIKEKLNFIHLVKTKRLSTTDINENWKKEAGVIQTSITDHFLTVLAIPINVNSKSKRNTNNIKKIEIINHEKVNIILKSEQWEDVYSNNDINRSCDIFYDKINNAISLATTIKNVGSRYKRIKEWMTAGLLCS
ncbi:E3 ubiquitin-protein ligase TRAIP-like, partial [Aphis craccivora]